MSILDNLPAMEILGKKSSNNIQENIWSTHSCSYKS